jgi:hypothetical protein
MQLHPCAEQQSVEGKAGKTIQQQQQQQQQHKDTQATVSVSDRVSAQSSSHNEATMHTVLQEPMETPWQWSTNAPPQITCHETHSFHLHIPNPVY